MVIQDVYYAKLLLAGIHFKHLYIAVGYIKFAQKCPSTHKGENGESELKYPHHTHSLGGGLLRSLVGEGKAGRSTLARMGLRVRQAEDRL